LFALKRPSKHIPLEADIFRILN